MEGGRGLRVIFGHEKRSPTATNVVVVVVGDFVVIRISKY